MSPYALQVATLTHAPFLQLAEQHSLPLRQGLPSVVQEKPEPPGAMSRHWCVVVVSQRAEQQSAFAEQASPFGRHAAVSMAQVFVGEPEHVSVQHSCPEAQVSPVALQTVSDVHLPASQCSEQQSVPDAQLSPYPLHGGATGASQLPALQTPEQQSQSLLQGPVVAQTGGEPLAGLTQIWFVSPQFVEQQSLSAPQAWPRVVQHWTVWHVPLHVSGWQHSVVEPQSVPCPLHSEPPVPHFPFVHAFAQH
jgi:hypothetical protein